MRRITTLRRAALLAALALFALASIGCGYQHADESEVTIKTEYGKITKVFKPGEGEYGCWWGCSYHDVNLRPFTVEVPIVASTKDNARLTIKIGYTGRTMTSEANVREYVGKFGLDQEERNKLRNDILNRELNTQTKNAVAEHDAYSLLAQQEDVQKRISDAMKPFFAAQKIDLENITIIDAPDFHDDRIEQAASAVVANAKLKQAAEARLEAAKIDAQTKQVEAQTYANPALLEIRKLELQREVAAEWAKHQGPLVLGAGGGVQMQLPAGR